MVHISTYSDLLSYAYNETGLSDSDRIQRSIDGDPVVRDEFHEVTAVLGLLDEATPAVPQESVDRILQFC